MQGSSGTLGTDREVATDSAKSGTNSRPDTAAERSGPPRWRPASRPQDKHRDGQHQTQNRMRPQRPPDQPRVSEQERQRDTSLITAATTVASATMQHAAEHGGELPVEVGSCCSPASIKARLRKCLADLGQTMMMMSRLHEHRVAGFNG